MDFGKFHFGGIEIDGVTYERDVVIDRGRICKRKKQPSKKFREEFGHTPLSVEEIAPVVLLSVPAVLPVTLTEMAQDPLAASVPADKLTVLVPRSGESIVIVGGVWSTVIVTGAEVTVRPATTAW